MFWEFIMVFILVGFTCVLYTLPVIIAFNRNLSSLNKTIVIILTLFTISWIVALVLSFILETEEDANIDKLNKITALYKDKVISKKKYEELKEKYKL